MIRIWHPGLVLIAAACASPERAPTGLPTRIAVFVANHTGGPVPVAGESTVGDFLFPNDRVIVEDVLGERARLWLARHGFEVIAPDRFDAANLREASQDADHAAAVTARIAAGAGVLWLDLWRWEPEPAFQPRRVVIALDATLVSNGQVTWSAKRGAAPVATAGAVLAGDADIIACCEVTERLLAPLGR